MKKTTFKFCLARPKLFKQIVSLSQAIKQIDRQETEGALVGFINAKTGQEKNCKKDKHKGSTHTHTHTHPHTHTHTHTVVCYLVFQAIRLSLEGPIKRSTKIFS
jgi:hypothetical protein